jgi:hypothetical protein
VWKFVGKELHTTESDVKVKQGFAEWQSRSFDNVVIFSWLFKHNLLDAAAYNLRVVQSSSAITMLNFACFSALRRAPGAGPLQAVDNAGKGERGAIEKWNRACRSLEEATLSLMF